MGSCDGYRLDILDEEYKSRKGIIGTLIAFKENDTWKMEDEVGGVYKLDPMLLRNPWLCKVTFC